MATTASFKQPCPSCEHPVLVRDPKLVGRKIDCPKCKYRFVVEDPNAGEEEEAPKAKKETAVKAGAAKGAAATAAKKAPARRRGDDDDDDDDRPKPSAKKGGSSTVLILGVGIGLVAVVGLVVAGIFMFGGGDSGNSGGGSAGVRPAGGGAPGGGMPTPDGDGAPDAANPTQDKAPPPAASELAFLTNLLPNDTEMVLDARMDKVLNSAIGKDVASSFSVEQFGQKFGFPLESVKRLIQAGSQSKDWNFSVVHTSRDLDWPRLQANLALEKGQKSPINGLEYYVVKGELDPFSNIFIKNNRNKPLGLHKFDDHTLVIAELGPLEKFLEAKAKPKYLSELPTARQGDESDGNQPDGGGPGPGMGPGAMMPGGPGGGAGRGYPGGGKGGGISGPGAMMPGGPGDAGSPDGGQPGGDGSQAPPPTLTHAWMTIKPGLKSILDRTDTAKPASFLSLVMEGEIASKAADLASIGNLPGVDLANAQKGLKNNELKALGVGLQTIKVDRVTGLVILEFKDDTTARTFDAGLRLLMPLVLATIDKELGLKINVAGGQPGGFDPTGGMMPGGPGMPGMPGGGAGMRPGYPGGGAGMMPGGPGGGGMAPPGLPLGGAPARGEGGEPGGPGGIGSPDGGGGGFPGGDGSMPAGQNPNRSTAGLSTVNDLAVLNLDLYLNQKAYDLFFGTFLQGIVRLKGRAEMVASRPRIHELAVAVKAHVDRRGTFPRGTFDRPSTAERAGRPFPPDQRISWMAEVVRYLPGYSASFANQASAYPLGIDPQKSWRDKENLLPAQTLVGPFLSLNSSEPTWWVDYPNISAPMAATHYVGVAGVGLDAADGTDAKLQGVFGYDRITSPSQIADGPDKTIAILQVPPDFKTPWLAGGGSTVRGIPEKDSVKPFVCGEHGGKKGTFAIMANGDVRFISAEIKDADFKALCTIAGGEKIDLDELTVLIPTPKMDLLPGAAAAAPAPATPVGDAPPLPAAPTVPAAPAAPGDGVPK